jgi:hypothetical protein
MNWQNFRIPQRETGWDAGLRQAAVLQQLAAPLIRQKELKDLRQQELEDYQTRRNDRLEDRDYNRITQLEDLQRQFKLKQDMGEMGGIQTTPINQAQGGRPASIGALPVQGERVLDPKTNLPIMQPTDSERASDITVASPGLFVSPSQNQDFQFNKLIREKRLNDLLNPQIPKGFNLSPGEQRYEYDQESKGFKSIASAPGKDAESKTYTLSPGQKVFDSQGNEIASIPATEKDSRPIVVSPGSTVIGADGKEIFKNPLNAKGGEDLKPILKEKAQNALSVIKDIKPLIGMKTVGTMGNVGRAVPLYSNDAKLLQGKVNSLKSQISMSELLKMKQSGASFGALSDTELALLGNSVDTLDLELQDAPTLLATISKIEELMKKSAGGPEYGIGSESGGSNKVGRFTVTPK